MSILDYANVGLRAQTGTNGVRRQPQRATVGWTSPTVIYQKQREIQVSAASLNGDIEANVRRAAFKASWKSWYDGWTEFFGKYQNDSFAKLGAVTYTDALAAQTEAYRRQLLAWYDAYSREKDGDKPMPPPSSPAPPLDPIGPPQPSGGDEDPFLPTPKLPGLNVPWYVWVGVGAAVVGVGYLAYRHYVGVKSDLRESQALLKERAVGMMLPPAPVARDPGYHALPPTYEQYRAGQQSCLCR